MSIQNLAKFTIIKENYFNDWGGELRVNPYVTKTMIYEPFYVPRNENRF
jgi:hypothetical protein